MKKTQFLTQFLIYSQLPLKTEVLMGIRESETAAKRAVESYKKHFSNEAQVWYEKITAEWKE